jgi:hypothetical protein
MLALMPVNVQTVTTVTSVLLSLCPVCYILRMLSKCACDTSALTAEIGSCGLSTKLDLSVLALNLMLQLTASLLL